MSVCISSTTHLWRDFEAHNMTVAKRFVSWELQYLSTGNVRLPDPRAHLWRDYETHNMTLAKKFVSWELQYFSTGHARLPNPRAHQT